MLGYCCINTKLSEQGIRVNRGMVKRTFESRGLDYVSELLIENLKDTLTILEWNVKNNILVYRFSSDSAPWFSHWEFKDLKRIVYIKTLYKKIGDFVKENNIRVGFHPGPFNVLSSLNPNVVENTIKELDRTAEMLDMMCLDRSPYYCINIHVGNTKPSREDSMKLFCENFDKLSDSAKSRLTIENDDKENCYSVKMLYDGIHSKIDIPIVFDQHHFNYGPSDQTMEESLTLALSTWKVKPITHMSSPMTKEREGKQTAHADYIYEKIETFGFEFDTEIEAKMKEEAVLRYIKEYEV